MFIDPNAELDVSDEKGNTIWIKAKMDFGDQAKIEASLIQLKLKAQQGKNSKKGQIRPGDDEGMEIDATVTYSARQVAILETCIKRWSGPDFEGVRCVKRNIRLLDPSDPLVEKVLETIDEANTAPTKPPSEGEPIDPNQITPSITVE